MSTEAMTNGTSEARDDMVGRLTGRWLDELDGKLEELRPAHEEFVELMAFRTRLTGDVPAPAATPSRGRTSRNTNSNTRATGGSTQSGGTRKDQFLILVRERPGITVKDACEAMGVQENYLYRLRKELKNENLIRIDGSAIHPVDQTQAQLAAREAELAASSRS